MLNISLRNVKGLTSNNGLNESDSIFTESSSKMGKVIDEVIYILEDENIQEAEVDCEARSSEDVKEKPTSDDFNGFILLDDQSDSESTPTGCKVKLPRAKEKESDNKNLVSALNQAPQPENNADFQKDGAECSPVRFMSISEPELKKENITVKNIRNFKKRKLPALNSIKNLNGILINPDMKNGFVKKMTEDNKTADQGGSTERPLIRLKKIADLKEPATTVNVADSTKKLTTDPHKEATYGIGLKHIKDIKVPEGSLRPASRVSSDTIKKNKLHISKEQKRLMRSERMRQTALKRWKAVKSRQKESTDLKKSGKPVEPERPPRESCGKVKFQRISGDEYYAQSMAKIRGREPQDANGNFAKRLKDGPTNHELHHGLHRTYTYTACTPDHQYVHLVKAETDEDVDVAFDGIDEVVEISDEEEEKKSAPGESGRSGCLPEVRWRVSTSAELTSGGLKVKASFTPTSPSPSSVKSSDRPPSTDRGFTSPTDSRLRMGPPLTQPSTLPNQSPKKSVVIGEFLKPKERESLKGQIQTNLEPGLLKSLDNNSKKGKDGLAKEEEAARGAASPVLLGGRQVPVVLAAGGSGQVRPLKLIGQLTGTNLKPIKTNQSEPIRATLSSNIATLATSSSGAFPGKFVKIDLSKYCNPGIEKTIDLTGKSPPLSSVVRIVGSNPLKISNPSTAQTSPTQTSQSKTSPARTSSVQPSPTWSSSAKPSPTLTLSVKPSPTEISFVKPPPPLPSSAKSSPTKSSSALTSSKLISFVKPSAAGSSSAKPSPTQTTLAKPPPKQASSIPSSPQPSSSTATMRKMPVLKLSLPFEPSPNLSSTFPCRYCKSVFVKKEALGAHQLKNHMDEIAASAVSVSSTLNGPKLNVQSKPVFTLSSINSPTTTLSSSFSKLLARSPSTPSTTSPMEGKQIRLLQNGKKILLSLKNVNIHNEDLIFPENNAAKPISEVVGATEKYKKRSDLFLSDLLELERELKDHSDKCDVCIRASERISYMKRHLSFHPNEVSDCSNCNCSRFLYKAFVTHLEGHAFELDDSDCEIVS